MLHGFNRQLLGNGHLFALAVVLLLLGGLAALVNLPKQEDPRLTNRFPVVLVSWPGVAPELLESLVIEPLEREIREESAVATIESTATTGLARLSIELGDWVPRDSVPGINGRLRDAVGSVEMPAGIRSFQFIDDRDPVANAGIIALRWAPALADQPIGGLSRAARVLADRIQALPSTDKVDIAGEQREEWLVLVDDQQLAALGIGLQEIRAALGRADVRIAAGAIDDPRGRVSVQVEGAFTDRQRIADVPLRSADGRTVLIGDVARIERGWAEPATELARVNGAPAVLVAAQTQEGSQLTSWAAQVDGIRDRFANEYAGSIIVEQLFDQRNYVQPRLYSLAGNLFAGVLVIIGVIILLMGWRSALVVGIALPLTIGGLMICLALIGVPLHQMSLFGLIIALGLLIDNAIVVVDEVGMLRRAGKPPLQAVREAVSHLGGPLLASTLTTVASFTPIMLLPGPAGEFIGTIAVSVNISLLLSFVISLTLIACWAARWSPPEGSSGRWWQHGLQPSRLQAVSARGLSWLLRRPVATLSLVLAISLAGLFQARHLGGEFFPAADRDVFQIRVWLPSGAAIEETDEAVRELDAVLADSDGVIARWWQMGRSFPPVYYNQLSDVDDQAFYAQGIVQAADGAAAYGLVRSLQGRLSAAVPRAQVVVSAFGQGPPVVAPVVFRLLGPDLNTLRQWGERYRQVMAAHPDVLTTRATQLGGAPELAVAVDEVAALDVGYRSADIADRLRIRLDGARSALVFEGVQDIPVRVRLAESDVGGLADMVLPTPAGAPLPLAAISSISYQPALGSLTRRNGERSNELLAWIDRGALAPEVSEDILAEFAAAGLELPPGYRLQIAGDSAESGEATGNLAAFAPVLVVFMAGVLILAFRSVLLAGLLGSVAVGAIGFGLLALRIADYPFGFNPLLGLAGLIGLALNDSIVVLAAIRADPEARAGVLPAVVRATLSCSRHVIATTLTTIGAFLPLLVDGGAFWPPLAVVIAGGVLGASLLALLWVPAGYLILVRLFSGLKRTDTQDPVAT
jgi:multidrug efflux pump subunit AcrB